MHTQQKSYYDTPGQSPFTATATNILNKLVANGDITQAQMQQYLDTLQTADNLFTACFGRPQTCDVVPFPLPIEAVQLMHEQTKNNPREVIDWLNKLTCTLPNIEDIEILLETSDHIYEFHKEVQEVYNRRIN